ncbi:MAG: hypothetical protein NVV69_08610 [Methyloversatilis sp.]|uniref:hypothetical protein n=1 Tax=Methyloversatilis sp. TaxID=2569862 RepID=UPI0025E7CBC8|nr:hypothetical protein [Methyloversatilis sp.]MCR6666055.1 hypothetical protein [Methyloversatilis sp.]
MFLSQRFRQRQQFVRQQRAAGQPGRARLQYFVHLFQMRLQRLAGGAGEQREVAPGRGLAQRAQGGGGHQYVAHIVQSHREHAARRPPGVHIALSAQRSDRATTVRRQAAVPGSGGP